LETILSYCDPRGKIVTQDFSSRESMVAWGLERIEELADLPLREQLKERSIRQVLLQQELSAHARITLDEYTKDTFRLRVLLKYHEGWALCIGHELAHTYFFNRGSCGLYRLNVPRPPRLGGWWLKEEEICEVFGEMWVRARRNHVEVYELLAPIASHGGVVNIF